MARKKRVTRKQLLKEPDEFMTTTGKLIRIVQTYQKRILYTIGAMVLVLLVGVGVRYYTDVREKKAFSLFEQATVNYDTVKDNEGVQQAYQQVKSDFELILNKFDRAIDLYSRSLKDFEGDAFYGKLISSSIGYAQEGKNDLKAAAKTFESMASEPESFLGDQALFHLGQFYEAMGNRDKSKAAFQRILSEYPTSIYFDMVSGKLSG